MLGRHLFKRTVRTPAALKLVARQVRFNYREALQKNRYWHGNDPVKTHFFNALQAMFPEGERFFMDSARDVRDAVGKANLAPELLQQIQMFIRQEAMHGREHDGWSQALMDLGYTALEAFDAKLKRDNEWSRKHLQPLTRLALTAASEHFTASLAHLFVYHRPDLVDEAASPFRELLVYHALEEVEHKAVCFDLYHAAGGGYARRSLAMLFVFGDIQVRLHNRMQYLLEQDGLWDADHRRATRKLIWGQDGIVRSLAPFLLQYFRPGFHPWETDEREDLIARFQSDMLLIDELQAQQAA